jgi:hypothetical protein
MACSEEEDTSLACARCAEQIEDVGVERGYLFAEDQALCYACATARGGQYDEPRDCWIRAPDLSGLELDGDHEYGPRGIAP